MTIQAQALTEGEILESFLCLFGWNSLPETESLEKAESADSEAMKMIKIGICSC